MNAARGEFAVAVGAIAELTGALKPGLQAIRGNERSLLSVTKTRQLAGSVDLDSTLQTAHPRAARWDYAVGVHRGISGDEVTWIEVHPANAHSVSDIVAKVAWLNAWLRSSGRPLHRLCRKSLNLVWISTGTIAIRRGSRQQHQLAQVGVKFPVRHLVLQ